MESYLKPKLENYKTFNLLSHGKSLNVTLDQTFEKHPSLFKPMPVKYFAQQNLQSHVVGFVRREIVSNEQAKPEHHGEGSSMDDI